VYGNPAEIPITENCPKGAITNPYGQTKSMLEQVLIDVQKADPEWNVVLLRYFTRSALTRAARSAKTRTAFRTT
jgi:UDP-glucose 4-epimerase